MKTLKSYTDIEQSKKLAEILPLETADMHYWKRTWRENDYAMGVGYSKEWQEGYKSKGVKYIPGWSLAALLETLSFPSLIKNKEDEWEVCVFDHDNDDYIEKIASNPIDACYKMIIKLHEKNLL